MFDCKSDCKSAVGESNCELEKSLVMSVSATIILDTRRIKTDNKYPVKLRVNFQRTTNYYPTLFDLSQEDWQKLSASRISNDLQVIRDKVKELQRNAENWCKEIAPFNFEELEKKFIQHHLLFRQRKKAVKTVSEKADGFDYSSFHKKFPILLEESDDNLSLGFHYKAYIKKLVREGRIGSAVCYHCSYVSLSKFKKGIKLTGINASFLLEYESYAKANQVSKTTIGIYLRPLRSVFNEAIEGGFIQKDKHYPFGRRRYQIPTSRNVKKALDLTDIEKIYHYACDPSNVNEQRSKDFWLFSYFANGMNPKDIARLQFKNIHGDYLIFERSKTENSQRSDPRPITVILNDDMKGIIQRWGNSITHSSNYIFPILQPGISALQQYHLVQNFVRLTNDWMKHILQQLGIDKKATTYVARHSFSTILKRSGASTEIIQEALGHSNLKTTEHYLDSFGNEVKKEFAARLTAFKKTNVVQEEFIS